MLSLMKGRTCFFIAHRLSTIRDADTIMVIGDGEILERGTHKELMEKRERYYEMVMSQLGLDA
ncbi:putative ABC transporter ATP-binding protein [bioreactor metagenome]|uniref:Putative ABC transporter ATP-binding protein n=1 Tax=bioreactor metagenome TaxID=1076179 RepID=A0A645AYZ4_9ZZZZ